jgi:hypothetical protein
MAHRKGSATCRKRNSEVTSARAASAAARVMRNPRASKLAKTRRGLSFDPAPRPQEVGQGRAWRRSLLGIATKEMLLHRFRFRAEDLAKLPEPERVFAALLGHISNEINILQKLIMMAHDLDDDPEPAEIQGRTAQTMCLLRVLVGKLNEAHVTIKRRYLDTGIHAKMNDQFDDVTLKALDKFHDYFTQPSNNMNVLHKKISFHNDWEFARQNVGSIPDDADLFIYTDETVGNTFFQFADLGIALMMSNSADPADFTGGLGEVTELAGLGKITDEAIELARCVLRFSGACLGIMISRHINFTQDQIEVHSACKLGNVRIPFFMVPVRDSPG